MSRSTSKKGAAGSDGLGTTTFRVGIYLRISTDEEHQPFSLDAQQHRLKAFISSQPGWAHVETYEDQISGAIVVQVRLSLSHRQFVVETRNPTKALVEIREPFFRCQVVGILRPRTVAADLGLIIDGLTVGDRAQKHQAAREPLLHLQLQRMVTGVSMIFDGREWAKLRVRPA